MSSENALSLKVNPADNHSQRMSSYNFSGTQHPLDNGSTYDLDELLDSDECSQYQASVVSDQGLADAFYDKLQDDNYYSDREDGGEAIQLGVSGDTCDSDVENGSADGHKAELAFSRPEETCDSIFEDEDRVAALNYEPGTTFSELLLYHLINPLPTFIMDELDLQPSPPRAQHANSIREDQHQANHSTIATESPTSDSSIKENQHPGSPANGAENSQPPDTINMASSHAAIRLTKVNESRILVQRAIARVIALRKAIYQGDPKAHETRLAQTLAAADARQKLRTTIHRQFVNNPMSIEGFAIASIHRAMLSLDRTVAARVTEQYKHRFARHNPISSNLQSLDRPHTAMTIRRPDITTLSPRNEVSPRAQVVLNSLAYHYHPKPQNAITATKSDAKKDEVEINDKSVSNDGERTEKGLKKDDKARELFRKFAAKLGKKKGSPDDDEQEALRGRT